MVVEMLLCVLVVILVWNCIITHLMPQYPYNPHLRPEEHGKATLISLSMAIMSLGPLDDKAEVITFTCYLR